MPLEICCYNAESAIKAAQYGADRIELCAGKSGGVTPSFGTIETVCEKVHVPIHVLIRPREGNFCYSNAEFQIMQIDIERCKELGIHGVVFGILNNYGKVDNIRCKELVEMAKPLQCIFHKAVDETEDIHATFETIIACGFNIVLTSGGKENVIAGMPVLKNLIENFGQDITIMPGGGIRSYNLDEINLIIQQEWYHSSALTENTNANAALLYTDKDILMCDSAEIETMRNIIYTK